MMLVSDGRDTYCLDELQPGRLARGVQLVAQRCYHRLITPARTLRGGEEEADFGLDLAGYIGRTDPRDLDSALPVSVQNELLKDPAVDACDVTAVRSVVAGAITWRLVISLTTTAGDVSLIVAASDVTVELLGIR